jgi:hypothetical protein
MRKRLVVAAAIAFMATGCSGDGGNDKASAETSGGLPTCSDVWGDGKTLPDDYNGCADGDTIEAAVIQDCDSGIGRFTTYRDQFHALLGGKITEAPSSSKEYAAAYEKCMTDS